MASSSSTSSSLEQRLEATHQLLDFFVKKYGKSGFGIHEALEPCIRRDDTHCGLMLRVKEAIESQTTLIMIPAEERITLATVVKEASDKWKSREGSMKDMFLVLQNYAEKHINEVPTGDLLCTVLLMYVLNNETRFDSFKNTWPSRADMVDLTISPDEEAIRGTYSQTMLLSTSKGKERFLKGILIPALESYGVTHLFCQGGNDISEAFQYAFDIANSRSHESPGAGISGSLIPLVDLANGLPDGSEGINVEVDANPTNKSTPGSLKLTSCLSAKRKLVPGEELIVSYGKCPPCTFLYKYGFVPDAYLKEHLMVDLVSVEIPPHLLPDPKDKDRIMALQNGDFPTTRDELADTSLFASPNDLHAYRVGANGIGSEPLSIQSNEPESLRWLRHFIILARVGSDELVQNNLRTQRIKGDVDFGDVGRNLLEVFDNKLEQLATQTTSTEERELLKDVNLSANQKTCIRARILSRDALAQWRHIICRHYGVFSSADDSEKQRSFFSMYLAMPDPVSLHDGGCSVCGRTVDARSCARCKEVKYCSKRHQVVHWREHKQYCTPVDK